MSSGITLWDIVTARSEWKHSATRNGAIVALLTAVVLMGTGCSSEPGDATPTPGEDASDTGSSVDSGNDDVTSESDVIEDGVSRDAGDGGTSDTTTDTDVTAPSDVTEDTAADAQADSDSDTLSDAETDAVNPDIDAGDVIEPSPWNACGGDAVLLFQGVEAEPGSACDAVGDGVLVCNGVNGLRCVPETPVNECGGIGVLAATIGEPCGCGGVFTCGEDGDVVCSGGAQVNACGGCARLAGRPGYDCSAREEQARYVCTGPDSLPCVLGAGNACGGNDTLLVAGVAVSGVVPGDTCDTGGCGPGRYVCDGSDALVCRPDQPCNACGGKGALAGEPDTECGACGGGLWTCEGTERVTCVDAAAVNVCGGCEALTAMPGESCLVEGAPGITICRDGESTCSPRDPAAVEAGLPGLILNACGGDTALVFPAGEPIAGELAEPGMPCGLCERGELLCNGPDALKCSIPASAQYNLCGGCSVLSGRPNTPCGTCGTGSWQCILPEFVDCVADFGEAGYNECGGCGTLPDVAGRPCGTCLSWQCDGGTLQCAPTTEGEGCSGPVVCEDLPCESENRACLESDGVEDARCGGCASGFLPDGGGRCRPVRTCEDLNCGAELRNCVAELPGDGVASPARDAECGSCVSTAVQDSGNCRPALTCDDLACGDTFRRCTVGGPGVDARCEGCVSEATNDGGVCRPPVTCATLATSCGPQRRTCVEGSSTLGTDAFCGNCEAGLIEDTLGGDCRPTRACSDLNCGGLNRVCAPESAGRDAACDVCIAGFSSRGERCEPVDCGVLAAPRNGLVSASVTTFESVAEYECDAGYTLLGDRFRACGEEGLWSGAAPTCEPITCGALSAPVNGSVSTGGTAFGVERTFGCDIGFVLTGASTVVCTEGGIWSDAVPECVPVDCGELSPPFNGSASGVGTTPGAVRTFSCSGGFTLIGSATRTCGTDGLWTGSTPVCQTNSCGLTPTLPNAQVSVSGSGQGAIATYTCDPGFARSGTPTLVCGTLGWEGTPPTCTPLDCGAPASVARGSVSLPSGSRFPAVATYSCESGYRLVGSAISTCRTDGTWSPAPSCALITCPPATPVANGLVDVAPDTRIPGALATHRCDAARGFRPVNGGEVERCVDRGGPGVQAEWAWLSSPLVCALRECPSFDIANASETILTASGANGRSVGAEVGFTCAPGYALESGTAGQTTTSRTCGVDGAWVGGLPNCVRVTCGDPLDSPEFTNGSAEIRRPNGEVENVPTSVATWYCFSGTTANGRVDGPLTVSSTCGSDGVWSAVPDCQLIDCGPLVPPANGVVSAPLTTLGAEATYECDENYRLSGTTSRTCTIFGVWSSVAPACRFVGTPPPTPESECLMIHRIGGGRLARRFIQLYNCGTEPVNLRDYSFRVRTGASANWTGWNEFATADTVLLPGSVRAFCNGGFHPACSNPPGFVETTLSWTGDQSVQLRRTATDTVIDAFGGDQAPAGSDVWAYRASSRLGCTRYLDPTGSDFVDRGDDLVYYPLVTSSFAGTPGSFGELLGVGPTPTFTCPHFPDRTACMSDMQCRPSSTCEGAPGETVCTPTLCPAPPNAANATVSSTGTTPGSVATYECTGGFSASALNVRTCGNDGQWRGEVICTSNSELCATDAECASDEWCPTDTLPGLRRCSPRVFAGLPHQMDFALVPAGTFQQGSVGAVDDEVPFQATHSRSYWVSITEVTQAQWLALTGTVNPSCFQSPTGVNCTTSNTNPTGPVERIDWYSAAAYANWLSQRMGLQMCHVLYNCSNPTTGWYDGIHEGCTDSVLEVLECNGYRLLTESEWERAARGGTTTAFFWGNSADQLTIARYAWFNSSSANRVQATRRLAPNPYGLYDTSGNVWEWASDWWSESYPPGAATDYRGPTSGRWRVARGGDFFEPRTQYLRSPYRGTFSPTTPYYGIGFRLARTVTSAE